jgi:hypothetical protein
VFAAARSFAMRLSRIVFCILAAWGACGAGLASDPRNEEHQFIYTLYPPRGFSVKKARPVLQRVRKDPNTVALLDPDGKFTEPAQWYYDLGSNPKNFEIWWHGYFSDAKNWRPMKSPVWNATAARNEGHRIIEFLGAFNRMVQHDPEMDRDVKRGLCNAPWRAAVERTVASTINEHGWLEYHGNKADMACVFHFVRTTWPSLGLSVDRIYTLDRAQDLVCTLLTEPWIINAEDRYVDAPDQEYL